MIRIILVTCIIAMAQSSRTPTEIKQYMLSKSMSCSTEHIVSSEELQMLLNHKLPNTKTSNCFIACVFKKFDWIDAKGLFDIAVANKFVEDEFNDDATKLENSKKLFDACKRVNDETPADDEAGCDRAHSLAGCLIENAPKMGIHVELGGIPK